jgi:hypothetical protein
MIWKGHVTVLVEPLQKKRPLERPKDKWMDIIKMDLRNRMGGRGLD